METFTSSLASDAKSGNFPLLAREINWMETFVESKELNQLSLGTLYSLEKLIEWKLKSQIPVYRLLYPSTR